MGCEPVLSLAATPDEAVSIKCTVVDKLCLWLLGAVDVCELYYWPARVFSRASCRCSSFDLSLGSSDMIDLRLWDALSRWCWSWRVVTHPMCLPILLDWALQIMYVYDKLLFIISSSGMVAMLGTKGAGPSKLWYKLRCLMALLWVSGHISAIDHSPTFRCLNIINNY